MLRIFKHLNIDKASGNQSGFTLMEVMIATFVFSIIALSVSAIFAQVIQVQRRGVAAQAIQENALFVLDLMSREIRVSQVLSPNAPNCDATALTINHPIYGTITYDMANGIIRRTNAGATAELSSSTVNFGRFNFCILGAGVDKQQPRITILTSVQKAAGGDTLDFDLQTTVSSRDVREEFLNQ